MSYSNNGEFFITGGLDHMVKLWDSNIENSSLIASPYFF